MTRLLSAFREQSLVGRLRESNDDFPIRDQDRPAQQGWVGDYRPHCLFLGWELLVPAMLFIRFGPCAPKSGQGAGTHQPRELVCGEGLLEKVPNFETDSAFLQETSCFDT